MFEPAAASETGFVLALFALGFFVIGALGSGRAWWRHEVGFGLVGLAAVVSTVALIVVVRGWLVSDTVLPVASVIAGGAAVLLGAGLVVLPAIFLVKVATTPWIHDITTDFADPPALVAAASLRPAHADSIEYPGERVAAIQRVSYPDVSPRVLSEPAADAYARAVGRARSLGWQVVAERAGESTFEAVVTSALFGFRDDVVVRITPTDSGCRVDMRSASRVGDTDLGVNAQRITAFLAAL